MKHSIMETSKGIHVCRYSCKKAFDLQVFDSAGIQLYTAGIRARRRSILQLFVHFEGISTKGIGIVVGT